MDATVRIVPPNRPPGAVALQYPANETFLDTGVFALVFTVPPDSDGDALHFAVELSGAADFTSEVLTFDSADDPRVFTPRPPVPQGGGSVSLSLPSPLSDGRWYWRVRAWDGEVWGPYSEVRRFVVDTVPPKLDSLEFVNAVYDGKWYNPRIDTVARIRLWYGELYPKELILFSQMLSDTLRKRGLPGGLAENVELDLQLSNISDGRYVVSVVLRDSAGHQNMMEDTLCVDGTPPVGYTSDAPDTVHSGRQTVRVFGATDGEGSGVAAIYLGVFSSPDSVPRVEQDRITIPNNPGVYYVRYYAVDHVGNQGEVKTDTVVVLEHVSLILAISDEVDRAEPGQILEYHIRYGNTGNSDALKCVIIDTIPDYTELLSVSAGTVRRLGSGVISWEVGDLIPGEMNEDTVRIKIADMDHLPGGELTLFHRAAIVSVEGERAWGVDRTVVEGVWLKLHVVVDPAVANLRNTFQIQCLWNRALSWGEVQIYPEGHTFRFWPDRSMRDTSFSFIPEQIGEHRLIFSGEDLANGRDEVEALFLVKAEEYFEVDRNHLELARGESVEITFSVRKRGNARIRIYNVAGELVCELYNSMTDPGKIRLTWDGKDGQGQNVNSGLYLICLESPGRRVNVKKLLVIR
jgi:uncharacterized repeat protein (TIGR01451 family)